MAHRESIPSNPDMSLPHVDRETIRQVESSPTDVTELYRELFEGGNEDLALALRRGVADISPNDLAQRGAIALLALRLLKATDNQMIINVFSKQLEAADAIVPEQHTIPEGSTLPPVV